MASIIQNIFDLVGYFGDVAFTGPLSILLLTLGFVLVAFPSLVLGYLAAGAAVDLVIPDSLGQSRQQRG